MDESEGRKPDPGPPDLKQSDFTQAGQGTGTSESQSGEPWQTTTPPVEGDHPQTIQAEPTPSTPQASPAPGASARAARNDSETGGR